MEIEGRLRGFTLGELPGELLREAKREGFSDRRIARLLQWADGQAAGPDADRDRCACGPRWCWRRGRPQGLTPGVPPRRHLRRRVRQRHALPLLHLGGRPLREPPHRPPQGDRAGRRAQPHRPGHRVRHLLLPRGAGAAGRGHRGHPGQLQPRDREHRLRPVGPALLRAAALRGGDAHRRGREARRRDRHPRRPDAAEPGPRPGRGRRAASWAPASTPSTAPRTATAAAPAGASWTSARRGPAAPATSTRPSRVAAEHRATR